MNKKIITIALALTLPLTVAAFPGDKGGPEHFDGHRGERVERLAKQLDLSAGQKLKLQDVFKEEHEKREAIRQETQQRMQGVLSPEQMGKFEELKKARHEKWQQHREERRQQKRDASAN